MISERQPFTYVLLRYRHDPLAGEFVNVGVVLHAPESQFLDVRIRVTAGPRLAQIFPAMDRTAFREAGRSIERAVAKLARHDAGGLLLSLGDAATYAHRVLPRDDSSFVWGPLGSGLTADPAVTLAKLYARFVAKYDKRHTRTVEDGDVWKPVHDLLVARDLADVLTPKAIQSPTVTVEFEHAWKNGAWHIYQPLSFDLTTDDHIRDKAAKWAGFMVNLRDAEEAFKTHFIVGAPRNRALDDAYARALEMLRRPAPDAEIVDVSGVEKLVDKIESEVRAHFQETAALAT